jgi:hypothetical protein
MSHMLSSEVTCYVCVVRESDDFLKLFLPANLVQLDLVS